MKLFHLAALAWLRLKHRRELRRQRQVIEFIQRDERVGRALVQTMREKKEKKHVEQ